MSTIRCIYHEGPPAWPASDQHPEAKRYQVGDVWVDAIGGEPSPEEIDAVLNPAAPPPTLTAQSLADLLVAKGTLRKADVEAAAAEAASPE